MTSFDFPVVPEVGIRTATSPWLTPAPREGRRAGRVRGPGSRPAVGQLTGVQDAGPGQAGDARLGDQRVAGRHR